MKRVNGGFRSFWNGCSQTFYRIGNLPTGGGSSPCLLGGALSRVRAGILSIRAGTGRS